MSSEITNKTPKKNDFETKEIRFSKINPAFNLVSLKARYRLNDFKRILPKQDYHNFYGRCKNMCEVGKIMSEQYSLSDLYRYEKISSQKAMKTFYTIDTKLVKNNHIYKIRKNKSDEEKEKENVNITKNGTSSVPDNQADNTNLEEIGEIKDNNNDIKLYNERKNIEENKININSEQKKYFGIEKDKIMIDEISPLSTSYALNCFTHISPLTVYSKRDFCHFSGEKTNLNKQNFKNITQYNNQQVISNKEKSPGDIISQKKLLKKLSNYLKEFAPITKKPVLISQRYCSHLNYTKCGGIIHKNSFFRNVNIKDMLPKPINLPLIRNNLD